MRILIRPLLDPENELDLTDRLVAAIADELWRLYGGNGELNWLEAEAHLRRIIQRTHDAASPHDDRRDDEFINKPRIESSDADSQEDDSRWRVGSAIATCATP